MNQIIRYAAVILKRHIFFFFFLAEHEIMSKMETSFEKVAKLESDVMSECKYTL